MQNSTQLRIFQLAVIISAVSYAIWYFMPYLPSIFDEKIQTMSEYDGYSAILPNHIAIYGSLFILWILAAIGVFILKNWGRALYTGLFLLSLIIPLLSGVSISTPVEASLVSIGTSMDGFVVAMAYFSGLSNKFK